jgi:sortase (surface protein transpeptidase)
MYEISGDLSVKRIIFVVIALVILGGSFFTTSLAATPAASRAVSKPASNTKVSPAPTLTPTAASKVVSSPSPTPTPVTAAPVKPAPAGNSLSIAAIGLTAPIVEVGTTPQNNIAAPATTQVGHWTGSATPGALGAAFLDGHLVGGAFAKLNKLTAGQLVTVRYSGKTYTYKVVYTETVPLAGIDMNKALSVYGGASEGLNMMTCAGTYSSATGTYDQRLTVYTVRVS